MRAFKIVLPLSRRPCVRGENVMVQSLGCVCRYKVQDLILNGPAISVSGAARVGAQPVPRTTYSALAQLKTPLEDHRNFPGRAPMPDLAKLGQNP